MHIAEIKVTNQWQKLEDLINNNVEGFVFDHSKVYTMQNVGCDRLLIIEKETIPETDDIGFFKEANEKPFYYKKTSGDLYIRSTSNTFLTVSDDN